MTIYRNLHAELGKVPFSNLSTLLCSTLTAMGDAASLQQCVCNYLHQHMSCAWKSDCCTWQEVEPQS